MSDDRDDHLLELLTTDAGWMLGFAFRQRELDGNGHGQLPFWPVDDFVATKMYVACPRRGSHMRLVECRACWCDVVWGYATASDALEAGETTDG